MNKFVKLPLFLGGVSLIFCTTLAIVVNFCKPQMEKNEQKKTEEAYASLYEGEINILDLDEKYLDFKDYSQIKDLKKIEHEGKNSYVYSLTTQDPQSGTVSFMLGIDSEANKVDAYTVVANNNSGYAKQFENVDAVKDALVKYGDGEGSFYRTAGATKTENAMKYAVNQAFLHYRNNFMGGNN